MRRILVAFAAFGLVLFLTIWLGAPRFGRWYVQARVLPRVAARLGCRISVRKVRAGFGTVALADLVVRSPNDGDPPLFAAASVAADFALKPLVSGRLEAGEVVVRQPTISLHRRADGTDNVRPLLARLRKKVSGATSKTASAPRVRIAHVRLEGGKVVVDDQKLKVRALVNRLRGALTPGGRSQLLLEDVKLDSSLVPSTVSLERVEVVGRLSRDARIPQVRVDGGRVRLLPRLQLTGIKGKIVPVGDTRVRVDMEGSYGGATARLWRASGVVNPFERRGEIEIRAARFGLGRIASILRETPVISPNRTTIDGTLKFRYVDGELSFGGGMEVDGLNLFHPGLARDPVLDLSGTVALAGRYAQRVLDISQLDVSSKGVKLQLTARLDRTNPLPVVSGSLVVPPIACQRVLDAFPPALTPHLQGFKLRGQFAVDLKTHIDFAHLDDLELGGLIGINHCRVVAAPPEVSAARLRGSFDHTVEVYPGKDLTFTIGPENPDYTPYDMISPNVIGAFLTTEDAGFFRHHGFSPRQFRTALARNLKRGGFRLGASTITMQTVKNVLLSQEKTLSRKLQELFLVWYVERELTKERLMEIYLNAIEFGPGIFGIGRAARHYFGKHPVELSPLEAAFFSTILPSPRRRYVQYCQGKLSPKWDRYVRRVLRKMHARGHITDEALAEAAEQEIEFARDFDAMSVARCNQMIKSMQESWRAAYVQRLKDAVLRAAPYQLKLYVDQR